MIVLLHVTHIYPHDFVPHAESSPHPSHLAVLLSGAYLTAVNKGRGPDRATQLLQVAAAAAGKEIQNAENYYMENML